ncbi:MAG: polysaccharide deacetylase family protein [Syntrophobacteraceae bacterium]|jgi:peptidoglycan/xylan/chitin deacetylase (PgdA/CDA1 family)
MIIWKIINKIAGIIHGPLRMIDYSDRLEGKCVLTFDDGPNENTLKVLDALKMGNVHGSTFCVQGVNARKYPWILRRIVDEGHTLANHTYDHPHLPELTGRQIVRQLRMCQDAVNDALGRQHILTQMRPPYGSLDYRVLAILHALNLEVLLWQVDSKDYLPENQRNPNSIVQNVFEEAVRCGHSGLILLHDIHETTAGIIPVIIQLFTSNGMEFTSVKSLLDIKYHAKYHTSNLLRGVWRKV